MKNFYPKAKGRIHPSPSPSPASPRCAARAEEAEDSSSLAALRILPVAVLALASALGSGDREVLAYLVARSLGEGTADQRRCGRAGGCGCFDCYTAFWSRWDRSPDRELIHRAIEAFEDHLAEAERAGPHARSKRRGGDRMKRKGREKERAGEDVCVSAGEEIGEEAAEKGEVVEAAASEGAADGGGGGERRKGWADVTAIFNSRLWSLWSPGD